MEIQYWRDDDDTLITATVKSILLQFENTQGSGEVSADELLRYYARTINRNPGSDFVIGAFEPLKNKLLTKFNEKDINKAIVNEE